MLDDSLDTCESQDILAVGYGTFNSRKFSDGLICCWSIKNPEVIIELSFNPEVIIELSFNGYNNRIN